MDYILSLLVCLFLLVIGSTPSRGSASHINLLKIFKGQTLSKFKDVSKSVKTNSFSFGAKTNDIIVERIKAKNIIWNINKNKDITFVTIAKINKFESSERSTLISIQSSVYSNLKYFEIYVEKSQSQDLVEGQFSNNKKETFRLGVSYQNDGLLQTSYIPLENYLRIGKWFNLMVQFEEDSRLKIYMDCELVKEESILKMDRIPSFAEIRLSQNTQEDIWTSNKLIINRFIGEMKTAKFLFGEEAFHKHSPCSQISEKGMIIEGAKHKAEEIKDDFQYPFSIETLFGEEAAGCFYNDETFKNGESWKNEPCSLCKCQQGNVVCKKVKCSKRKDLKKEKKLRLIENGERWN